MGIWKAFVKGIRAAAFAAGLCAGAYALVWGMLHAATEPQQLVVDGYK